MKCKIHFVRKLFLFFIFLHFTNVFSDTCINFADGRGLQALLHSIGPAHQIIKTGLTTTITEPGSYQIIENITGNIVVNANDVQIYLNDFTLSTTAGATAISVSENVSNVVIKGGSIFGNDQSAEGILVNDGASSIFLEDLKIANCSVGIRFLGQEDEEITCCKIRNCFVTDCVMGFALNYCQNCVFENCQNCCCTEVGFELFKCEFNKINKCKSVRVGSSFSDKAAVGFSATSGRDNLFFECMAEGIYKSGTDNDFCKKSTGFLFTGSSAYEGETESKIINCLVDSISSVSLGNAYGIQLGMILKNEIGPCPETVANFASGDGISDVAWSPLGDKVAISFGYSSDVSIGVKIFEFDCCSWSQIHTLTFQDVDHLEWDPTGRYLAMGANPGSGPQAIIYDTVYQTFFLQDLTGTAVQNPVWSRNGKYVVFLTSAVDGVVEVFEVSENVWTSVFSQNLALVMSPLVVIDISPDEKFIAVMDSAGNVYIYDWTFWPPFLGSAIDNRASELTSIKDAEWSPIACNGKYYLVVVGSSTGSPFETIEIFEFDGTNLSSITKTTFDNNVLRVKWAPNGKYLAVLGTNGTVAIVEFTQDVIDGGDFESVYTNALGFPITSGGLDWSPSGRYLAFGGDVLVEAPDFKVLEVANVPTKCMIANNKIANVSGGLCGIGIEGSNACNGIMKNICYECDLPFSKKVLDVWYCGMVGIDQLHYNFAIPPY